jgi:hypothetical protein
MLSASASAGGDMVLHWNEVAINVLRADRTLPGPGWSSRALAIESIAVFDAVNAIDGSFSPYASSPRGFNEHNTSMDAAIASAGHDALVALYPVQKTALDAELASSLAGIRSGPKVSRGVTLGQATASAILNLRQHDGSDQIVPYTVNPAPGHWQPDPLNPGQIAWGPGWGQVTPFALSSGSQFRAPPPPAIDSPDYAAAFNEVKSLGAKNSTTRTADQTQTGIFWGYDRTGMGTPPALYCQSVEIVSKQQHTSESDNARLFALVNIAQADAGISAWDSKYVYDYWRPVAAIRRADEDGNAATIADPTWEPLGAPGGGVVPNFTPPFPAYISGHATFGAATFKVLADFYHTDNLHFTLASDELPGVTRGFDHFSQAAAENGRSRIYLGIHWNFDDINGEAAGRQVADWAFSHLLQRREDHDCPRNRDDRSGGSDLFSRTPIVAFADVLGLTDQSGIAL